MIERNFVTRETLAAIEDVNRRCHELHVPAPPVVFVTTELFERDGSPVLRQHEQARSWTRNLYNAMASMFLPASTNIDPGNVGYGAGSLKCKAVNGALTSVADLVSAPTERYVSKNIGSDANQVGILVGRGIPVSDFEGFGLTTIVTNGEAANQMTWVAAVNGGASYDSELKKWVANFYRNFVNNSGGEIIISETAWYVTMRSGASSTSVFCLDLTTLAEPVEVADGRTLRVTYTTEMTFPA
jgi:hypothetical protein